MDEGIHAMLHEEQRIYVVGPDNVWVQATMMMI